MRNKILIIGLLIIGTVFFANQSKAALVGNANQATLSISPATGNYKANDTFTVSINVDTKSKNVVVVAAYLTYDTSRLQAVSIDSTGTVFPLQAENSIDASKGLIKITRGKPTPGVNSSSGLVAKVNFKAIANASPTSDNVVFQFMNSATSECNVILDDGLGTDYLSGVNNAIFTITGGSDVGSSSVLPVSAAFAKASNSQVVLTWSNPADSNFLKTVVIRKEGSAPASQTDGTKVYEGTAQTFTDTNLSNSKTYYYAIYAVNSSGAYSTSLVVSSAPSSSTSTLRLINDKGTFYLVKNGKRAGITNAGMLYTYGFEFKDSKTATAADLALPLDSLLLPQNGALVKSKEDPTVYLISGQKRYGFVSATVFTALGFKFKSVLVVTNPELQALPKADNLANGSAIHLPGLDINDHGTIYWIGTDNLKHAYPSTVVYNSWHIDNDYSRVVPANAADGSLQKGSFIDTRVVQ